MKIDLSDDAIEKLSESIYQKEIAASNFKFKTKSESLLRNIKVLLVNYRYLKNHIEVQLPEIEENSTLSKYELSLYTKSELNEFYSVEDYRNRSRRMMSFVNLIVDRYKAISRMGTYEENRQFDVIYNLYIDDNRLTYKELSNKFHVDENTIRRDEKKAINKLSVMVFGIDGINDLTK